MSRVCQRCGATRDASRFCTSCGLDFWRAAAEESHQTTVEAPTPPPSTRGGAPIGLLAIGLGVVLLVVAAGGLWLLLGDELGRQDAHPPLVAPRPSLPAILTAFYHEARDPEAAFTVNMTGTMSLSGAVEESYDITVRGRLDAEDWALRLAMEGGPNAIRADVVVLDGIPHIREAGGAWVVGAELRGAQRTSVSPFARISTVAELEYLGPERRGGVDGHLIVTEKWLGRHDASELLWTIGVLRNREARMEIFVDDDGVPIFAEYTYSAEARSGGETLVISGTESMRFSDWDNVEPIEPPVDTL